MTYRGNKERTAMKWPKDREKAFLWAAKAFGTPYSRRTEEQKELASDGFCRAIWKLTDSKEIYSWVYEFGDKTGIESAWWWPVRNETTWNTTCDKQRSLFCYLMAALSDKEFEELQA